VQEGADLWLLGCNIARPPDAVREMVMTAGNEWASDARLSLPDADIVKEVVAVHHGEIL
jgi:hypothetical protein